MNYMSHNKYARLTLILCTSAAVLYNSWPLGYVLNKQTARSGLASDLERAGQPYYWLFILGDILTGICLVAASFIIWFRSHPVIHKKTWATVSVGIFLFGLGTAIAALVPVHCSVAATLECGTNDSTGLGLDALFSGIAALGLFASLVSVCVLCRSYRLSAALIRITWTSLVVWSASGILFSIFALSSGEAAKAQFAQNIFLILCGLDLIVIGLNVDRALKLQSVRG